MTKKAKCLFGVAVAVFFFATALHVFLCWKSGMHGETAQSKGGGILPGEFAASGTQAPLVESDHLEDDCFRLRSHSSEDSPKTPKNGFPDASHPVRPEDASLLTSGTNSLRAILGPLEETYVFNSVHGLYLGDGESIPYARANGITRLFFPNRLIVDVENATGRILIPSDLPNITEEEIADLTWREIKEGGHVGTWVETLCSRPGLDGTASRLVGFQLDEIRFVSDRVFVAWRVVVAPPSKDGSFIRLSFGIDRKTKSVSYLGLEIHEY